MGVVTIALIAQPVVAKRAAPEAPSPVVAGNVEYSAPPDHMGIVVASDVVSGRELWRVRVYDVHVDPAKERDVQEVFITSLRLERGSLVITNERDEKFTLDLSTRAVTSEASR